MGNASGLPVRWSIIVKMCLFPDVDVLHSVTRLIVILSNGLSGFLSFAKGNAKFGLLPVAKCAICNIFSNILVHTFPVILPFIRQYVLEFS